MYSPGGVPMNPRLLSCLCTWKSRRHASAVIFLCAAGCGLLTEHRTSEDFQGVIYLTNINTIETEVIRSTGAYVHPRIAQGKLQNNHSSRLIKTVEQNFYIQYELRADGYSVRMVPKAGGRARISLYTDELGKIRHTWDGSPASKDSPEFR